VIICRAQELANQAGGASLSAQAGGGTTLFLKHEPICRHASEASDWVRALHLTWVSKDRTNLFKDEGLGLDEPIGKRLLDWLDSGAEVPLDLVAQKRRMISQVQKLGAALETNAEGKMERTTCERVIKELTGLDLTDEHLLEIIDRLAILLKERAEAEAKWQGMQQTAQSQPEQVEPEPQPTPVEPSVQGETAIAGPDPKRRARKVVAV
jgi:hypothetical protein